MRDEQRRRRSQYDRGTSLAEREEWVYEGYETGKEEFSEYSPNRYSPPCRFNLCTNKKLLSCLTSSRLGHSPLYQPITHPGETNLSVGAANIGFCQTSRLSKDRPSFAYNDDQLGYT